MKFKFFKGVSILVDQGTAFAGGLNMITLSKPEIHNSFKEKITHLPVLLLSFLQGYWRISPYLPLIVRSSGLKLTAMDNFLIDTDRHVSKQVFAHALGGQLIWAIDKSWEGIAKAAQQELLNWSLHSDSYGCVNVNAWVGDRS